MANDVAVRLHEFENTGLRRGGMEIIDQKSLLTVGRNVPSLDAKGLMGWGFDAPTFSQFRGCGEATTELFMHSPPSLVEASDYDETF